VSADAERQRGAARRAQVGTLVQTPGIAYVLGASGALMGRALSLVAGVLSLWLLAQLLSHEDFAGYAAAMAVVILLGHGAGLGIERAMLLRLPPLAKSSGHLVGRSMMLRIAGVVIVLSGIVVVATLGILGAVPALGAGVTDDWIAALWPVIPGYALLLVLVSWYQSNQRVGIAEVMPGVADGARCLALSLIYIAGSDAAAVPAGVALSLLLPIVILVAMAAGRAEPAPSDLRLSDASAGLKFLLMRLSTMGLRQIDLIVMGFLVGGSATAAYAVASRIGDMAQLGQQAFVQTYAPRVRQHLVQGDTAAIVREYNATRALSFLLTLGIAFVLVLGGRIALELFGDFSQGYPVLLLVLAGHLVTASFGGHDVHLSMTDHLRAAMANRVVALAVFAVLLALLVPPLEGIGAALSYVGAATLHGVTGAVLLARQSEARLLHISGLVAGLIGSGGLILVALTGVSPLFGLAALLCAAAVVMLGEAPLLVRALGLRARFGG
jgi:O-antigen/teichoic acid export membrane protein